MHVIMFRFYRLYGHTFIKYKKSMLTFNPSIDCF